MSDDKRMERDSMGQVLVPKDALYGAQTQRAVENFTIDGPRFPRAFIRALGLIKASAADVNLGLSLLDPELAAAIADAALEVARGEHDKHFPLVIYQTGSGTSTNMNANEVIASRASSIIGRPNAVHPNDHVNMGQSSNDVIPAAVHVSTCIETREVLMPALHHLERALKARAAEHSGLVKTGRTHLMDAMPLTLGQEIGGWAAQVHQSARRIESAMEGLCPLALGGTAVGTGINAHPEFGKLVAARLTEFTGIPFCEAEDHFAAQGSMDAAVAMSGQLKACAVALMKVSNDLRWMNSGPIAGLGEIMLPALQPGSSIMPGKVNPVIPEAMMMVSARVIGNDAAVAVAGSMGNFELNVMLPVIAASLLESATLLGTGARTLADKAVAGFRVNEKRITSLIDRNPILVTALNSVIGYDKAAEIAKRAYAEGRTLKEVAGEMTDLTPEQLDRLLDPKTMA